LMLTQHLVQVAGNASRHSRGINAPTNARSSSTDTPPGSGVPSGIAISDRSQAGLAEVQPPSLSSAEPARPRCAAPSAPETAGRRGRAPRRATRSWPACRTGSPRADRPPDALVLGLVRPEAHDRTPDRRPTGIGAGEHEALEQRRVLADLEPGADSRGTSASTVGAMPEVVAGQGATACEVQPRSRSKNARSTSRWSALRVLCGEEAIASPAVDEEARNCSGGPAAGAGGRARRRSPRAGRSARRRGRGPRAESCRAADSGPGRRDRRGPRAARR
jgi:hypothetical protein